MATPTEEKRYNYRPVPQVSANQMAEYIASGVTPTRRRTIIKEAQFPTPPKVTQYKAAREGLVKFLGDGARSPSHLAKVQVALAEKAKGSASDWVKNDCKNSAGAIKAFEGSYNKSSLRKLDCRIPGSKSHQLDKWPTLVSVGFDLTVHKASDVGAGTFGAALFMFNRGEASSAVRKERCGNIAGLIYTFCSQYMSGGNFGEVDPALCLVVDVFGGAEYRCPGTFARKLRHVQDSCDEIATLWHTIPPPADYDGPPLRRPR